MDTIVHGPPDLWSAPGDPVLPDGWTSPGNQSLSGGWSIAGSAPLPNIPPGSDNILKTGTPRSNQNAHAPGNPVASFGPVGPETRTVLEPASVPAESLLPPSLPGTVEPTVPGIAPVITNPPPSPSPPILPSGPGPPVARSNTEVLTPPADKTVDLPSVPAAETPPAKTPKNKSFFRRRSMWLLGSGFLVCLAVGTYYWAFAKPDVVYSTAAVERGDVQSTVVAAGIVQPVKYVDVGAQTSGKLKSLKVIRGDHVKADQLLAEIDPVLANTALTSAKATLENVTSQRALRQAQLVLATLQRDRNDTLFAHMLVSASERDVTKAAFDVAFADAASLSAQMKQANAAVNTAQANLGYTKITAPMAGEVVSISLLEGQTLNANQQAPNILRIADTGTMTVWAQVSEADIVRVKIGQQVYFTVLGQPRRWTGKIRQILPTPELINNVVFYDVLFDIPNTDGQLGIQMTAQVYIVLAQAKGVLLIPTAAIGNADEGAEINVHVLNAAGKIEKRSVKIGIKSEIFAEVKSGLVEKDQVVIGEVVEKTSTKSALSTRRGP